MTRTLQYAQTQLAASLVITLLFSQSATGSEGDITSAERELVDTVSGLCDRLQDSPVFRPRQMNGVDPEISDIDFRGNVVGNRYLYDLDSESLRIDVMGSGGQPPRVIAESRVQDRPVFFVGTDNRCEIRELRRIEYRQDAGDLIQDRVLRFDSAGEQVGVELLNPASIASERNTPGAARVRVAMVDSGVNYLLPEVADGLARDYQGQMLGFDFWDMDNLPYDSHTAASPFFIQRHGTATASLAMRGAGDHVAVVSYRYPRPNLGRMVNLIRHADGLGVRIIGMPLGSNRLTDWIAFENAARDHPHILFVVSPGNGGRDIDVEPVYPAALDLANMVVVSSADDFAGIAERVNYGAKAVDYLVPAERQSVVDYSGADRLASGSSYAVSRVVAMLGRLLAVNPALDSTGLIEKLDDYVVPTRQPGLVSKGYIPDPRAPGGKAKFQIASVDEISTGGKGEAIPVDVLVLDPRWDREDVAGALRTASEILSQCEVAIGRATTYGFEGPDYLRDLETGAARTLFSRFEMRTDSKSVPEQPVRVVLARDTRMAIEFEAEAFGVGNTRSRPWLNNSLWIAWGAPDLAITIAHELFHILANDGRHLPGNDNLMAAETSGGSTALTESQCTQLRAEMGLK